MIFNIQDNIWISDSTVKSVDFIGSFNVQMRQGFTARYFIAYYSLL